MLSDAIDALSDALGDVAGELVQIQGGGGGGGQSEIVNAVMGKSSLQLEDDTGAVIQVLSIDFKICASDLPWTPRAGDRITRRYDQAALAETYELMSPPYHPADHQGRRLRLHSMRVSQAIAGAGV